MKKLSGESLSIINESIRALSKLFPEAIAEGKVNFEILRQLLGDSVDVGQERYSFTWNGKSDALRISQTPSLGTLRPCKEESKNWDMTRNIYIEGDNLEVLKLLQKSYYGKVKMIYIESRCSALRSVLPSISGMLRVSIHINRSTCFLAICAPPEQTI